ncbi:MAG: hypothetical protein KAR38_15245 [Calditrichia bacterium]|nr:hypothetical protein [Calditrichia bacterium]
MDLKLPQEKERSDLNNLIQLGTDQLIQNLLNSQFTGYLSLKFEAYHGLAVFNSGELRNAYFKKNDEVVSVSVSALLKFRKFENNKTQYYAASLPEKFLSCVVALYIGKKILDKIGTNEIELKKLYDDFKGKLESGILLINNPDGRSGLIRIKDGKWIIASKKEELYQMFKEKNSVFSLITFDEDEFEKALSEKINRQNIEINLEGKFKELITETLVEKFGKSVDTYINKLKSKKISCENVEKELEHLQEFLVLFVSEKETMPVISDLKEKIHKLKEDI